MGGNPLVYSDPKGLKHPSSSKGGGNFGGSRQPIWPRPPKGPSQPLPGYNWCGPGDNGLPPIDALDQGCKEHDECYADCDVSSDDVCLLDPGQGDGPSCQDDCDDAICNIARQQGMSGWILIGVKWLFCDP